MLLSKIKDEEADDVQFRVLSENRLGDRFSPHNWEQVAYWVQEVINERITYAIITITFTHTQIFGWYFYLMPMQADPLESYQQKLQSNAHLSV